MASHAESPWQYLPETLPGGILASLNHAVVTIDDEHRIVFFNKAAEKMLGFQSEEVVGHDVSPLIPEPHQAAHTEYIEGALRSGASESLGKSKECSIRKKDGSTIPVDISCSSSQANGRLYFTAIIRDISRRKELERQMHFMEKLVSVGKAVAQVVHEIRKPLVVIGGFARQVEGSAALRSDDVGRHKLSIIVEEIQRLDTLLDRIRLMSRPPMSGEYRPLSIRRVLNETLELLEPMLQDRRVALIADLPADSLFVCGDSDQLKQVFLNVLQNAVESMNGGGLVRIESRLNAGTLQLVFHDEGPGVPPDLHEKVFDPFFSTKVEGTGLGLPISRTIIEEHGGRIGFLSGVRRGAVLIVELPVEPVS